MNKRDAVQKLLHENEGLVARLAERNEEVERLVSALESISIATPCIERITGRPDKVEGWCAFASRIQSVAALAVSEPT